MEHFFSQEDSEFSVINKKELKELIALIEELVINKVRIEKIKSDTKSNSDSKILDREIGITSRIQDTYKKMIMVKMRTVYTMLMDMANKYSSNYKKDIKLTFQGEDIEIENSLIDHITDIFEYFLKDELKNDFQKVNNISYNINIETISDSKNISISMQSAGKGFDYENSCNMMNRKHIDISTLKETEIPMFLEQTSSGNEPKDILKLRDKIAAQGGNILVKAKKDEYRRVVAILPVSTSIIQALLVKVSDQTFAIPLEFIETIINKNAVLIKRTNNTEMIVYRGGVIRLINVSDVLNMKKSIDAACVLIVKSKDSVIALLVDTLLDQTDVVIKPKPAVIREIKEYRGTTILGDGLVTLVLDVAALTNET